MTGGRRDPGTTLDNQVHGPAHWPEVHEVLFTNKRAVVVPAGFVEEILKQAKAVPLLEHHRKSNLYVAEVKLSSVTRHAHAE